MISSFNLDLAVLVYDYSLCEQIIIVHYGGWYNYESIPVCVNLVCTYYYSSSIHYWFQLISARNNGRIN
jgi:hypothetical protein